MQENYFTHLFFKSHMEISCIFLNIIMNLLLNVHALSANYDNILETTGEKCHVM